MDDENFSAILWQTYHPIDALLWLSFQSILEETTELLVASRNEIFNFLQVIQFLETKLLTTLFQESKAINSPISENLVNALKFIRSIYESTEQRYRDTLISEV